MAITVAPGTPGVSVTITVAPGAPGVTVTMTVAPGQSSVGGLQNTLDRLGRGCQLQAPAMALSVRVTVQLQKQNTWLFCLTERYNPESGISKPALKAQTPHLSLQNYWDICRPSYAP
jgi:hypothetical protein